MLRSIERISGKADRTDELPLIILLHGLGDGPENFAKLLDDFDTPSRIIAIQAPWKTSTGYSWSKTNKRNKSTISKFKRTAARISTHVEYIVQSRGTRGKPLLLGHSQGGVLAYVAAAADPEHFSAVVPIAAFLPEELYPTKNDSQKPIIRAFHGYDDPVTYAAHSRRSIAKLGTLGYDAHVRVYLGVGHWVSKKMNRDIRAFLKAFIEQSDVQLPECLPCPDAFVPGSCSLCDR